MKVAIILFACVAATSAQGFFNPFAAIFNRRPSRPQQQRPQQRPQFQQQQRPQQQFQQQQRPQQQFQQQSSGQVDDRFGNSEYHYSWRHDGNTFSCGQAAGYCQRLGGGWQAISIESAGENNYVTRVIQGERLDYIWTGASRRGNSWSWPSGGGFSGLAWSHTGGAGTPQPDNREGNENCIAVLNNFYGDGVRWHDVAPSHLKPTICER